MAVNSNQKEGIAIVKREGKFKGRMPRYTDAHEGLQYALKLYDEEEMTIKRICAITKISKSTLYRALDKRKISRETV